MTGVSKTPILAGFAFLFLSCAAIAGEKEVRTRHVTFIAPESFDSLWSESDAVIHVKVLGGRAVGRKIPQLERPSTAVHTDHRVRVLEVFRGPVELETLGEKDLTVIQVAGEIETIDQIIRIADEVPLSRGSEYVLFLKWHPTFEKYQLWQGRFGIFENDKGVIRPQSDYRTEAHNGKPAAAFFQELRQRKDWK